ncbi:DUF6777 domain-containing protein [Mycobacterium hubeiense]|uniref:DUF6777 domain-containing protein n=1 Tax=Mycobacterium hubeiense TaxID=1867256 RepID=UPI00115B21A5|nr:DUF6777 domain-containing protein [Mycobacterium sp. QGD 101]
MILAASGVVLTVLVVAALVWVVLSTTARDSDSSGGEAVLVAANDPLGAPFTRSVVVVPVTISDQAASKAAALLRQVPVRATRGVRLVSGRQPELYGATGEAHPCDVATLANDLDADPATARAWGVALGLAPQQIPFYLNTLTPVVVMGDTWLTFHTLEGGAVQPKQAVLQAGNAVLIDPLGVPRAHCASGSPLTPPDDDDLTQYRMTGEEWNGFSVQNVLAIKYAAADTHGAAHEFTLIDVTTGEQLTRKAGGTIDLGSASVLLPDPAVMNIAPRTGR